MLWHNIWCIVINIREYLQKKLSTKNFLCVIFCVSNIVLHTQSLFFFLFSQDNFFQKRYKCLFIVYGVFLYAMINAWLMKKLKILENNIFWKFLLKFKSLIYSLYLLLKTKLGNSGRFKCINCTRCSNVWWFYFWIAKVFATCVRLRTQTNNFLEINFFNYQVFWFMGKS